MIEPNRERLKQWGLKPLILAWIIPIFLVASVLAVIFNYLMARGNDEKRIADYIQQRRMDLIYLTGLPSLQMYLMNLKLGLEEEAAFVKEDVKLYNVNYLKNQQPTFPHILSLVSLDGKELLRIENGEIQPPRQDFSASPYLTRFMTSRHDVNPSLPVFNYKLQKDSSIMDVFPVYSDINKRVVGGIVYEYQIPVQTLMQHSQRVFIFNVLLSCLTSFAALLTIYFALGVIIKPLNQLIGASRNMLSGDLSTVIKVQGYGETKTLAAAFEDLRWRLENRIRELRENSRKLESIIDFLPVATFIIDQNKKVLFWNKAIEEMTGLPREKVVGTGDFIYALPFYGEKRPVLIDLVFEPNEEISKKYQNLKLSSTGRIEASNWCRTLEGERRLLFGTASALYDDAGKSFGAIEAISDMTELHEMEQEKKQLQAQLLHAQKMEAIGTLAGGVAHDFNNLIHAIQGFTEILLLTRAPDDGDYKNLKAIEKSAKRASELTSQLLIFSRKGKSQLRPMDLNREVREIHNLLQRIIPKMIDIELVLEEDLHNVSADSSQLEQILINLAINARDAMPEGGNLIIETANVYLGERFCEQNPELKPGDHVCLRLSDTGLGMEQETMDHIFDPFFTTKEIGKGTGLGLAMVYGIIKSHDGIITCSSRLGKGTTFTFYLPVSAQAPEKPEPETSCDFEGGSETILLVDDDDSIRTLGETILSTFGYSVLLADNGEKGLELYQRKQRQIDLIILDMIMPGMGGKKCLEELLKINPNVQVIIASGYSDDEINRDIMDSVNVSYIAKPYQATKMLDVIRDLLRRNEKETN